MPLDPEKLFALRFPEIRQKYTWRDTILYALGTGFGMNPVDERQLHFVDETKLKAVPTIANVLADPGFWMRDLDTGIDWIKVVHGEQAMRIHRPLRPEGEVIGRTPHCGPAPCSRRMVAWWKGSPSHRRFILSRQYRYAGVGIAKDGGSTLWTIVFVD